MSRGNHKYLDRSERRVGLKERDGRGDWMTYRFRIMIGAWAKSRDFVSEI